MSLSKEIIVLGDLEIGAGNLTDDFISDQTLSELILELAERPHPVDLIFNGDTFDFLKCPYFHKNQLTYPRHITENISLSKLKLICRAHQPVFEALKKFLRRPAHRLFLIIGNHDPDLAYKKVRQELKKILASSKNSSKNIYFPLRYQFHQVYVEHGQQYDFLNQINFRRLFLDYKGETILNLPFVSFGAIAKLMHLKEEHPFLERIFPRPTLLSLHQPVVKKITLRTIDYFFKSVIYYPFRYYADPTYIFPRELFREFYRRMKNIHFEVDEILHTFKKRKKASFKKNRIYILGHVHEKYLEDKDGVVIIHPGSWRDEYDLDPRTRKLTPRPKHYVQILIYQENLEYQLISPPIKRTSFDFDKVINNEPFYLQKAAEEEGFKPVFY